MPLDFDDLIAPLSVARFTEEHWGKKLYATALGDEVFEFIKAGFYDGELSAIAADCRKDDNSRYSHEEVGGMESDLEERRATLNFPFCFAPAALELKRAFIEGCEGLGNDVEVGVYFSRVGGDPAQWHSDNNHNITVQICGQKDWLYVPGNPNTTGSRAMLAAPRNRHEQDLLVPPVGPADHTCYNLRPGSVLYIPPGHWHSVVPAGGDSCSVDLRVGNVVHAKWICEAVFAGLLGAFGRSPGGREWGEAPPIAVGPSDLGHQETSAGAARQARYVAKNLPSMLAQCRLPRCFPFETEHSDGLHTGATLAFLKKKRFMVLGHIDDSVSVGVNGLVAVTAKLRDSRTLVVHLSSTSSLSGMDYLRFSLLCGAALHAAVRSLARSGSAAVGALRRQCDEEGAAELTTLLRVLLHANVLYVKGAAVGKRRGTKRLRSRAAAP